jgi:hypothetical protein
MSAHVLLLVGCGKAKADEPTRAADLYTGSLFKSRLAYVQARGGPWWIVSARHGLVSPDQVVFPYDLTLPSLPDLDRAAWALQVVAAALDQVPDGTRIGDVWLELHMGFAYADPLRRVAAAVGANVSCPVQGLRVGEQRQYYAGKVADLKERHS